MTDILPLSEIRKRAAAGDASSQYDLGLRYERGLGLDGEKLHIPTARRWFHKAARQGHPGAELSLSLLQLKYSRRGTRAHKRGETMLRDLADRGRPTAQFILAVFLAQGIFLDKDESRARQLLDNSASSGHPLARIAQDELARDPAQSLVSVLDPVALVSQFRKAQVQPRLT